MTRFEGLFPVPAEDTALAEAATWLARHQAGTIDEPAFLAWRDDSAVNALAFARALALWERFDPEQREAPATAAPALQAGPPRSRRAVLRAAAAMLAVGIAATGVTTTRAYAWSSATTALGENKTIRLPDGSKAALNTDSRLSWRFSGDRRVFWIERGEVALDLCRGPVAVVRGDDCDLLLSEGRFNVRRRGATLDMLVLAGRAQVGKQGGRVGPVIDARHGVSSVLVSSSDVVVRPANAEQIDGITAWQNDEILFQDATLGSAVEEYNRFLTHKIVIVDRDLSSIQVGGRFTTTDPSAFLHAISRGLNIRVSQSPTAYLLTR